MSASSANTPAGAATGKPREAAVRAQRSRGLEVLTRAGLICYGVVHLLVAWLAVQIAAGHASEEGDQSGAFQLLAKQPGGRVALFAVVLGMAAMTVWQALVALVGYRDEQGTRRVLERLGSAARSVVYGALAVSAATVALRGGSSSAGKQENATAGVLGMTGGRFLVALAGLVIVAVGVGLAVYGIRRDFEKRLLTERMSAGVRRACRVLGAVGYLAKGVAYTIVGVLLVLAAVRFDPNKARGLDAALRLLASQSYGPWLLGLVALGIAAFGVYCFSQARYRRV